MSSNDFTRRVSVDVKSMSYEELKEKYFAEFVSIFNIQASNEDAEELFKYMYHYVTNELQKKKIKKYYQTWIGSESNGKSSSGVGFHDDLW